MASDDTPSLEDLAADLSAETPDVKEEPVVAEPTDTESSTDESTEPDAEEETSEPEGDDATEEAAPDTAEEPVEKLSPAEERKQQLNTEIRDLVTQRRDLQAEVERLNSQVYAPQSIDDLTQEINPDTGEYYSRLEARVIAGEQARDLAAYNNQVAEAQLVIGTQSQRVLQDFPMFNPDSPDYKPEVANNAASIVAKAIQTDPNTGQVMGSNIDIYNFYQTIASANQASAVENQLKGRRASAQESASAEPQSSAAPKQAAPDPFLQGLMKGYGTGE